MIIAQRRGGRLRFRIISSGRFLDAGCEIWKSIEDNLRDFLSLLEENRPNLTNILEKIIGGVLGISVLVFVFTEVAFLDGQLIFFGLLTDLVGAIYEVITGFIEIRICFSFDT